MKWRVRQKAVVAAPRDGNAAESCASFSWEVAGRRRGGGREMARKYSFLMSQVRENLKVYGELSVAECLM